MFNGSVPSTSPLTNSYPLISFCCSALTVPYVLMRGLDILPPGFRCFELHLRCRGLHFVSCCRIRYQLHSREIQIKRLFLAPKYRSEVRTRIGVTASPLPSAPAAAPAHSGSAAADCRQSPCRPP